MMDEEMSDGSTPGNPLIRLPTFSVSVPDAIRLLRFKLGVDGSGTPLGDSYLYYTPWEAFDGLPPVDPDDITVLDLTATVAMNSNVVARHVWVLAKLRRDPVGWAVVTSALRQIPPGADIRVPNAYAQPTAEILRVFLGPGAPGHIRTAILFKVLCRLRPGFFPMWDNVVQRYAEANALGLPFGRTYLSYAWQSIPWFQRLVVANWQPLQQVTAQLATDGVPITELRALESLIWLYETNSTLLFSGVAAVPWPSTFSPWQDPQPGGFGTSNGDWPAQAPESGL